MEAERPKKVHENHRKPKPWDHEGIDHWKIEPWTEADAEQVRPFAEESMFATLFPRYREKYLQSVWGEVDTLLTQHGVEAKLDLIEGSMTVTTTRRTRDPYIILKARDLIKLLARSVPFDKAKTILQDDVVCDVIKIGGIVRNRERFVKRRARLLGPDGNTLKALELLTDCYILVQGNTVAALGGYKGLKEVRRIVEECMKNVHPIYNIKRLMLKQQLAKDPKLAEENWDRFLPKFKKQSEPKKKKPKPGKVREKALFPPAPMPRKEDLAMMSGQAFFEEPNKKRKTEEKPKPEAAVEMSAGDGSMPEPGTAEHAARVREQKRAKSKSKRNRDDGDDAVPEHKSHRTSASDGQLDERTAQEIAARLKNPGQAPAAPPPEKKLKGLPEKGTRHQELDAKMAKERKKQRKHEKKVHKHKKHERKKNAK